MAEETCPEKKICFWRFNNRLFALCRSYAEGTGWPILKVLGDYQRKLPGGRGSFAFQVRQGPF